MNSYFYRLFLPFTALGFVGAVVACYQPWVLWWTLAFWVLIGPIGSSIGFHRLFAHRQFETHKSVEYTLAILGTLSTYGPLTFWCASHQAHHSYTDTEKDPTTPLRGFWHSALTWNLKKACLKEVKIMSHHKPLYKDPVLSFINDRFFAINYAFLVLTLVLNWKVALGGWLLAALIERVRIGLFVNWLLHVDTPLSYRNHDINNSSHNLLLFPLTAGFSFHNDHHHNPREAREGKRWFELNIEAWLLNLIRK
jgi:fatty-acid desaturase